MNRPGFAGGHPNWDPDQNPIVRLGSLALDRGIGGPLEGPSAYLMKSPPRQMRDNEARDIIENFIQS